MRFVDEVRIEVEAGNGGNGSASFRREKYIPFGGPDGGDGGEGGSIYVVADPHLTTLVDYRYTRRFKAQNGEGGKGAQCSGKSGEDKLIVVPIGTMVYDMETEELMGEVLKAGDRLLVAKGGERGLGNVHFKSSVNRAPRHTIPGKPGECRMLKMELKLLADVGLLGFPNAGKSSFIRVVSDAKPKVADYPFTTMYPHLGVVRVNPYQSFVVADIPGIIEGAAEGAGLGARFLKHLSRTAFILHLVDLAPPDGHYPLDDIDCAVKELIAYDPELGHKKRWLVLNKIDCLDAESIKVIKEEAQRRYPSIPIYTISAITGEGVQALVYDIFKAQQEEKAKLELLDAEEREDSSEEE